MKRNELIDRIRDVASRSAIWPKITRGKTSRKCKRFSIALYEELQKPENRIEGLSAAVVVNQIDISDHAWLVVHHPDVGYLMVDTTANQFIEHGDGAQYNDIFIGSYHELEKMLDSGHYKLADNHHKIHAIWSPVICFFQGDPEFPHVYDSAPDNKIWENYEFPIAQPSVFKDVEEYGKWAARLEEYGIDWKKILFWNRKDWPDMAKPKEIAYYEAIKAARNRHIRLGVNKDGQPFSDILSGYRTRSPEDKKR